MEVSPVLKSKPIPKTAAEIKSEDAVSNWGSKVEQDVITHPDSPSCRQDVSFLVDGTRIVLWGTSTSGAYGIINAAEDPNIAGVIAQCTPFDHKEDSKPYLARVGYGFFFKLLIHGQR
ncbi:MAG: hypothetical protein JEY99_01755 [Spirochaetales bacterium]|nr:hypothetical protein [Spirochaetales bacterium]